MRASTAKKIRRAQDETVSRLLEETAGALKLAFKAAPFWLRLWWAIRGKVG